MRGPGEFLRIQLTLLVTIIQPDGGTTWTFELMGRDGLTPVFNRTGYLPIFENFGQANFAVDNNGVVHVGMNGYAFRITATDTSFGFPALIGIAETRNGLLY